MSLPCLFILGGCLAVLVLDLVVLIGASSWWLQAPPSGEEGSVQVLRGLIESFVGMYCCGRIDNKLTSKNIKTIQRI